MHDKGICSFSSRLAQHPIAFLLLVLLVLSVGSRSIAHGMPADFDGDGLSDLTSFDPTSGRFRIRFSQKPDTTGGRILGPSGSFPAVGDYNADGIADQATFDRRTGIWRFRLSDGTNLEVLFGSPGDIPVPASYSGYACTDLATYNPQTSVWTIANCQVFGPPQFVRFGLPGDIAVPGFYDADSLTDLAVVTPQSMRWRIRATTSGLKTFQFGLPGDIPIPANYFDDPRWEAAVFRPSTNEILVKTVARTFTFPAPGGTFGDRVVPFDVEGDGYSDLTTFHPSQQSVDIASSTLLSFFNVPVSEFVPLGVNAPPPSLPIPPAVFSYHLAAVAGDYTRDLRSEVVLTRPANGLIQWIVHTLRGHAYFYEFGWATDAALSGDLDGDLRVEPVAVRTRRDGGLDWFSRRADGKASQQFFGLRDDTLLLGDFDCDGTDDRTVVRGGSDGGLRWFVLPSGERIADRDELLRQSFGLVGDEVFAADMNGDGCDEAVVAQRWAGGIWWFWRSMFNGTEGAVLWGLADRDNPLHPMDFDGDGAADPAVAREENGIKTAFLHLAGHVARVVPLGAAGTAFAGHFHGLPSAEVAVFHPAAVGVLARATVHRLDGHAGDVILGAAAPGDTLMMPGSRAQQAAPDALPPTATVQCDSTGDFLDGGGGGRLWKPFSDNTGRPVFLLPGSYWERVGSVEVFGNDGEKVLDGTLRNCCHNGGRAHYDIPADTYGLDSVSPLTIRLNFRGGGNECLTVPMASQRFD
ncbi:MAG: hypothetical protein KDD69_05515 [Bdellovibrionales bacterium]|nr:hypothetical protein [Bdellovibrionales bacterium]